MKPNIFKKIGYALGYIAAITVVLAMITASWMATCGIVYSITMAFGWSFDLYWATGIWGALIFIWCIWPDKKEKKETPHD